MVNFVNRYYWTYDNLEDFIKALINKENLIKIFCYTNGLIYSITSGIDEDNIYTIDIKTYRKPTIITNEPN